LIHEVDHKSSLIWLPILLMLFIGCKNNRQNSEDCQFTGVLRTDSIGNVLLTADLDNDWCIYGSALRLFPAFPNPTSDSTKIRFTVFDNERVIMKIVSPCCGETLLVDSVYLAGDHYFTWRLNEANNEILESGIYRCLMKIENDECYGDIEVQLEQ
jgi:hypothetical protein